MKEKLILLVLIGLFVAHCFYLDFTQDDAFIFCSIFIYI